MQIQLFTMPISDDGSALAELNKFLLRHKVLENAQHFYQNDKGAAWCFCVRIITGVAQFTGSFNNKVKVDYKQVLTADEFEIFSKLRECRKKIAFEWFSKSLMPDYKLSLFSRGTYYDKGSFFDKRSYYELSRMYKKGKAIQKDNQKAEELMNSYNTYKSNQEF